jgi:hypothetical protein
MSDFSIQSSQVAEISFDLESMKGSATLSKDQINDLELLCDLKIKQENLLYRASKDGFGANNFHEKCDHKPNTLTIIKSENGNVFGGFTAQTWDGNARKYDNAPFLFSLINNDKKPVKMDFATNGHYSILCKSACGPTFGAGHDLHICDKSNEVANSFSNPNSFLAGKTQSFLAGSHKFKVKEIEVYSIKG